MQFSLRQHVLERLVEHRVTVILNHLRLPLGIFSSLGKQIQLDVVVGNIGLILLWYVTTKTMQRTHRANLRHLVDDHDQALPLDAVTYGELDATELVDSGGPATNELAARRIYYGTYEVMLGLLWTKSLPSLLGVAANCPVTTLVASSKFGGKSSRVSLGSIIGSGLTSGV